MERLEIIQDTAINIHCDMKFLINTCFDYAQELDCPVLARWLKSERDGYDDHDLVPPYRVWPLHLKGHFIGLGTEKKDVEVEPKRVPKHLHEEYLLKECRMSLQDIRVIGKQPEKFKFFEVVDFEHELGHHAFEGMNCVRLFARMPIEQYRLIPNIVRDRILDISLLIWKIRRMHGELPTNLVSEEIHKIIKKPIVSKVTQTVRI